MLGGVYSEENCPICGTRMVDNHRDGVTCPKHKKQYAHNFIIRFGRKFFKRTTDYDLACRILTGIRFKFDEGTYDPRDYQRSNPLGIENQLDKFWEIKQQTLKSTGHKSYLPMVRRIQKHFGAMNVKSIGYAEIEDFLFEQKDLSDKSKYNLNSIVRDFYRWLLKRKVIKKEQMPEFPEIKFELGTRKILDKATQAKVLAEVKRLTWDTMPRAYIGILWASTYINTRPGELLGILESDINYESGIVAVRDHKTAKSANKIKFIPLSPDDLEMIKALPRGFPHMPFFRRDRGGAGQFAGAKFGPNLFYTIWKRACTNLGIEDVDLYGGTRHSSASALRRYLSFEDVRSMTGHETNEAFQRYFQEDLEVLREQYQMTREKVDGTQRQDRNRNGKM